MWLMLLLWMLLLLMMFDKGHVGIVVMGLHGCCEPRGDPLQ